MSEDEQDAWLVEVQDTDQVNATRTIVQGIVEAMRFNPQYIDDPVWLSATADSFRAFAVANPTGY